MNKYKLATHLTLAVVFTSFCSGLLYAEEAATDTTVPVASAPAAKKQKAARRKRVMKTTPDSKAATKIETAPAEKSSRSEALQAWFREVKKRIARAQTRNNQVVAVAAVRGAETPDTPPLYWKGKAGSGPVEATELKQFDEAIDSAMSSDPAAEEKLQAFLAAHPTSPMAGEARETLAKLEKPAN